MTAAEVVAIVVSLSGRAIFTEKNLITAIALLVAGLGVTAAAGVLNIAPALRWFEAGREPTARQRDAALRITTRQPLMLLTIWAVNGAILVLMNLVKGH